MKQTEQDNSARSRLWILLAAGLLLVALSVFLLVRGVGEPDQVGESSSATTTEADPALSGPVDLGGGLTMTDITVAAGIYPEGGEDVFLPAVLCITVRNDTEQDLQVSQVELTVNGKECLFELTNLPAGESLRVYEKKMASVPDSPSVTAAVCLFSVYYSEPLSLDATRLELTPVAQGIRVKNISGEDIEDSFYIYYKTVHNDVYVGGITYRVRVESLAAGREVTVYAGHATSANTRILFVEYGDD